MSHQDKFHTFHERTKLGIEWVPALACAAKSFQSTQYSGLSPYDSACLEDMGLQAAEPSDLNSFKFDGHELDLAPGLRARVFWAQGGGASLRGSRSSAQNMPLDADQKHKALDSDQKHKVIVVAFRWQEGTEATEQAYYWYAKEGARLFYNFWLPKMLARHITGGKDHGWVGAAARLVDAVRLERPGERIAFTGFSLGTAADFVKPHSGIGWSVPCQWTHDM